MKPFLVLLLGIFGLPLQKHWTQTADETIWRGRYTNCDKGWAVDLAANTIAHASLPPSPNHGFLISTALPDTSGEVNDSADRIVGVHDLYDTLDYGGARAYLQSDLKEAGQVTIIEKQDTTLVGLPAAYVHYRSKSGTANIEHEELVAYRGHLKNSSPILYVVWLRTPSKYYARDRRLFLQLRNGFHLLPIATGECSNE